MSCNKRVVVASSWARESLEEEALVTESDLAGMNERLGLEISAFYGDAKEAILVVGRCR